MAVAGRVTEGLARTGHVSQTLVVLHLQAQCLEEGDGHPHPRPHYALLWNMVDFIFYFYITVNHSVD